MVRLFLVYFVFPFFFLDVSSLLLHFGLHSDLFLDMWLIDFQSCSRGQSVCLPGQGFAKRILMRLSSQHCWHLYSSRNRTRVIRSSVMQYERGSKK